jgi:hypothetical protein
VTTLQVMKTRPCYTFSKEPKLRMQPTGVPEVGTYDPDFRRNSCTHPSYGIGSAPKHDAYWDRRLHKRSPGPVYNYNLDKDTASPHNQRKVVS